jgi:Rieske Fe-S protein
MNGAPYGITSRRAFCGTAGAALLGIATAACASAIVTRVTPVNGRARLRLADFPDLSRKDGALRVLPDGAKDAIFVLTQDNGSFVAVSSVCTHRGCTVDAQGARLVCPCHGSTYDRSGRVLVGPAERPLTRFPTHVTSDGVLEISLGGSA